MKDYRPYRFWNRGELFNHCEKQCIEYNNKELIPIIKDIIFDNRWFPINDYNGCNMVQDKYHPYVPCLIHDYRWMVEGGGIEYDREFRRNLIKFGTPKNRSIVMFVAVRLGWFFYYKWTK